LLSAIPKNTRTSTNCPPYRFAPQRRHTSVGNLQINVVAHFVVHSLAKTRGPNKMSTFYSTISFPPLHVLTSIRH